MKNKKKLILLTSLSTAVAALCITILPHSDLFKTSSLEPYSCELPDGYIDIDDVITEAINAGETKTANTLEFRGTVTRRFGDICYVQRQNQLDHTTYGIKVKGVSSYAPTLSEGNVVDFKGGFVYRENGVPTFELSSENDAKVAYSVNPYGYEPIAFQSIDEFYNGADATPYYDSMSDKELASFYGTARLLKINNLVPSFYSGATPYDPFGRDLSGYSDALGSENELYILADSSLDLSTTFDYAKANFKAISVTGYFESYYVDLGDGLTQFNVFTVVKFSDMEITGSSLDTDLITDARTSNYVYYDSLSSQYYRFPFAIYNIVGHNDVSYVEFKDFYNNATAPALFYEYHLNHYNAGNNEHYFYHYGATSTYDFEDLEFDFYVNTFDDEISLFYDSYNIAFERGVMVNGIEILADGGEADYCSVDYNSSKRYGEVEPLTFDLSRYSALNLVEDKNGNVYAPLQVLNTIFNDNYMDTALYNGKDLYYYGTIFSGSTYYSDTPWADSNFDGTVSSEFAEYNYQSLCLSLERVYGLAKERDIYDPDDPSVSADALIESLGYKEDLMSTNVQTQEAALAEFAGEFYCDGHSGYGASTVAVGSGFDSEQYYVAGLYNNDRYMNLVNANSDNLARRNAANKNVGVSYYEDTVIITFDNFYKFSGNSGLIDVDYWDYETLHDNGTELFFKKAFNDIGKRNDIHNIVIDLTLNGGGANNALIFVEAYMTNDPIHTQYNMFTGLTHEVHYDVDINFDGTIDSDDTYKGKYDFYMMTSNFSFSCGNYLPTVTKQKGLATLIGQTSGGGTCPVGNMSTAYGTFLRNSSCYQLGQWDSENEQFLNNDAGIEVDYEFNPEYFYNDQKIWEFIHSI